mgnify:CR=1 FL=1
MKTLKILRKEPLLNGVSWSKLNPIYKKNRLHQSPLTGKIYFWQYRAKKGLIITSIRCKSL